MGMELPTPTLWRKKTPLFPGGLQKQIGMYWSAASLIFTGASQIFNILNLFLSKDSSSKRNLLCIILVHGKLRRGSLKEIDADRVCMERARRKLFPLVVEIWVLAFGFDLCLRMFFSIFPTDLVDWVEVRTGLPILVIMQWGRLSDARILLRNLWTLSDPFWHL